MLICCSNLEDRTKQICLFYRPSCYVGPVSEWRRVWIVASSVRSHPEVTAVWPFTRHNPLEGLDDFTDGQVFNGDTLRPLPIGQNNKSLGYFAGLVGVVQLIETALADGKFGIFVDPPED